MIIETHFHPSHFKFENSFRYLTYDPEERSYGVEQGDRGAVLEAVKRQGVVAAIEPGIDLASNGRLLELAQAHPGWLYCAVGLHPTRAAGEKWRDRGLLVELSKRPEVVAVGETGLDFHYARKDQHRLCQLRWFVFQLLLAHRRGLPLVLHIRQAKDAALAVLRLFRPFLHGGVAHCFYGDVEAARAYIALGFHLGIGGTLLQDTPDGETLRQTVRQIPLEHLLLETDAPYVHPTCDALPSGKMRSKVRNTPLILPAIAQEIARLKGLDAGTVQARTAQNAIDAFRLPLSPEVLFTEK